MLNMNHMGRSVNKKLGIAWAELKAMSENTLKRQIDSENIREPVTQSMVSISEEDFTNREI